MKVKNEANTLPAKETTKANFGTRIAIKIVDRTTMMRISNGPNIGILEETVSIAVNVWRKSNTG